jgi:predicted Zn-dependent peptidase
MPGWRDRIATVSGAARLYREDTMLGVDDARDSPARVAKVTREDLVRVANAYLTPSALHVLFLGDERGLNVESLGMGSATPMDLAR